MAKGRGKWLIWVVMAWMLPLCTLAQDAVREDAKQRKLSYFYMAAQRAKGQENYAEMLEMLAHCQDIDPYDAATNFELGQIYLPLGMDSLGLAMLEYASAKDAGNPWYLERLAAIYLRTGEKDKATNTLERMATLQTKRTDVLTELFMLYRQTGRTQDAIKTLERIQTLQGRNTRIAEQMYLLYMDLGEQERAIEQVKAVCQEFPYDASSHLALAAVYLENEMPDSAKASMERAERIDPQNNGLKMLRLQVMLEEGDTLAYEQKCDSLILDKDAEIETRFSLLRDVLTSALQDEGQKKHLEEVMGKLLAEEKPEAWVLNLYKHYDAYLHQDSAGYFNLELTERLVEANPSDISAQMELVQYYIGQNDSKNLQRVCSNALIYNPSELRLHYFLAVTYLQEDRDNDAVETLKAGIRQADEDAQPEILGMLYSMLGDMYHSAGKEAEAFAAYDSCLVYSPNEISCLNNYAYYLSLKGEQLERAEEMSYRTIKMQPDSKTYLDTYAWILFMQEDYTTARIYMDRAVNVEEADSTLLADTDVSAVLLEHSGDIYSKCEQMDVALRLWQLAIEKTEQNGEKPSPLLKKKLKKKKYLKK